MKEERSEPSFEQRCSSRSWITFEFGLIQSTASRD